MARTPVLLILLTLVAAGCTGEPEGTITTPAVSSSLPTSDPFAPPGEGTTGGTPGSPTPPPVPSSTDPPYTGWWTHDHMGAAQTLVVNVAPGTGPSDFLFGFQPNFAAGKFRCASGTDATVKLTDPAGRVIADVRAGDRPVEGAGCPVPLRVPAVDFVAGNWTIAFGGSGELVGFIASGNRAGPTNVALRHEKTHDHMLPENQTIFSVPDYATAVDVTIRVQPRDPGDPCDVDSVRVILRDPSETVLDRLDVPSTPPIDQCSRSRTVRDVILTPGVWTIQWGGSGQMISSVTIEPTQS